MATTDAGALEALHGRVDDLGEQVAALAAHGASDRALEALRVMVEGLAARLDQLERRLP